MLHGELTIAAGALLVLSFGLFRRDGKASRELKQLLLVEVITLSAVLVPAAVADPPMDYRPIFRPPRIFPRTNDFEIEGEEE